MTTSTIKRGDAARLTLDIGADGDIDTYTGARVLITLVGGTVLVDRAGTISGQTVSVDLTPADTATPGVYVIEVEMTPGPHTYPSPGYATLVIEPDLG